MKKPKAPSQRWQEFIQNWRVPKDDHPTPGIGQGVEWIIAHRRKRRPHAQALSEQPFDPELLELSPLFRRSRELFLKSGGSFRAAFVSSPRSLGSPALLDSCIDYSPIESEFFWAATDLEQKKEAAHLLQLRTYTTSLFHEQNHRILWKRLPPPPRRSGPALERYLNFAESLVIMMDMALADHLGPKLAGYFYLTGAIYDPGTAVGQAGLPKREYRNYLQALLHGTYLHLMLYNADNIAQALEGLFPTLARTQLTGPDAGPRKIAKLSLARRAALRSTALDHSFVSLTNYEWQKRNGAVVIKALSKNPGAPLELSPDPLDNHVQYLIAEKWFDEMGL